MLSNEDIKQIAEIMREELKPINERLDRIEENIEIIKEDAAEVRTTVEEICKWIDLNFDHKYPFPIDKNIGVG